MQEKITIKQAKQLYKENNKRVVDSTVDGFVVLKDIGKVYQNRVQAVFDFNLSINQNEFIVLVGPSGCGKSTTLRMIAGLEDITKGYLYIDKVLANYLESKDRDIAMVFQNYALYPNLTVYDNIGFGLKAKRVDKETIRKKVFEAAEILDLGQYLDRYPRELSGGQMQRVALGRAIVRDSKLFLLDEPLSNLDAKLRVQMRSEIVKLHKRINATTIYVTHDQTEAMTMADRIVVMNKGVIQQIGTPMEIYNNPNNVFVATFVGNPPMNVFKADIQGDVISDGNNRVELPQGTSSGYRKYIEEKQQFFKQFAKTGALEEQQCILSEIDKALNFIRKKDDQYKQIVREVVEKMLSLKESFTHFTEEDGSRVLSELDSDSTEGLRLELQQLKKQLQECDLTVEGILKKYDSAGMFVNVEKMPVAGKTKKNKQVKTLTEKNLETIDRFFNAYSADGATSEAYVGIRPEDIHFCDTFNGNKSNTLTVEANFVELLGSEYCIYIELFGTTLIMKAPLQKTVHTGDKLDICFDMDKLRLFDGVSGTRVK